MGEQWGLEVVVVLVVLVSRLNSTTPNQLMMQDSRINGWNNRVSSGPWGWSWQLQKHHPKSKGYEVTHDTKRGFDCLLWHKRLGPYNLFFVPLETPSVHSPYPRPEMKPNQTFCCWVSLCLSKIRLHDSPDWDKITSCVSPMANHMGHQGLWGPIFWHTIIYPKDTSILRICWVHHHGLCDPRTHHHPFETPLETWLSMNYNVSYQCSNLITYHVNPLTSP
jgi:hypothetical protein